MRGLAFACLLALGLGCPSKATGPDPIRPGGGTTGAPRVDAGVPPAEAPDAGVERAPASLPVDGASCDAAPCVYHRGADAYFACLSGSDGMCFHFGARCTPASPCAFDAATGRYRQCTDFVEGACRGWGADCSPAGDCAYNPTDGRHHRCEAMRGGRCERYGPPCDPR